MTSYYTTILYHITSYRDRHGGLVVATDAAAQARLVPRQCTSTVSRLPPTAKVEN